MFEPFIEMLQSIEKSNKSGKESDKNTVRLEDSVCYLCGEEAESEEGQYGCKNCQGRTYDRKQ